MLGGAKVDKKVVYTFLDGQNKHEIVKINGKYINRYFVKDNKARTCYGGVNNLTTALQALKKRFPNSEQVKD